jgi:hypothetical protein
MTASPHGRIGMCLPEWLGLVATAYDPTPRGITSLRHEGEGSLGTGSGAQEWQGLLDEMRMLCRWHRLQWQAEAPTSRYCSVVVGSYGIV